MNQAVLTGETFPVEKTPGVIPAKASLAERTNCVAMGTSVRSGMAQVLIVQTGKNTVFSQISERLSLRPDKTEFERGVQNFGYLLTQVMLVMTEDPIRLLSNFCWTVWTQPVFFVFRIGWLFPKPEYPGCDNPGREKPRFETDR